MTVSNPLFTIPGLKASVTQASNQFKIMRLSTTAGEVKVGTSATSNICGVLLNDPGAGEAAEVQYLGIAKVLTEASVTVGGIVVCSSTGRAKLSTTGGDRVLGIAMDAANAAGDLIRVLLSVSVNGD
jgi:hypothetical protein